MSELNIHQRILAIMGEIDYIQKTDKKVNNQYTFVTHDAVTKALHPLFVKHGIVAIPRVTGWKQDGNRTEVNMEVDFVNVSKPEDKVIVPCFGFGIDAQDKGVGKAVSYATKYAMLKLFMLETGDDPERDSIDHVSQEDSSLVDMAAAALEKGDWAALCELDRDKGWLQAWRKIDNRKKKAIKDLMGKANEYRDLINDYDDKQDDDGILQLWNELTDEGKTEVWRRITKPAQDRIKQLKKAA
jgi:hypothetical protein